MKNKVSIEQLFIQENQKYDEHIIYETENEKYPEHRIFPTDNKSFSEFADDKILSMRDKIDANDNDEVNKTNGEKGETQRLTQKSTINIKNTTQLITKAFAGFSVASTCAVSVFIIVAVLALDILPITQKFLVNCNVFRFEQVENRLFVNLGIDSQLEHSEAFAVLYRKDEEYYQSQPLSVGQNTVEFYDLYPNCEYVFEVNYWDMEKEEQVCVYNKTFKTGNFDTHLEQNYIDYNFIYLNFDSDGVLGEIEILNIDSGVEAFINYRADTLDESQSLTQGINLIEFFDYGENDTIYVDIVCVNKTTGERFIVETRELKNSQMIVDTMHEVSEFVTERGGIRATINLLQGAENYEISVEFYNFDLDYYKYVVLENQTNELYFDSLTAGYSYTFEITYIDLSTRQETIVESRQVEISQ